MKPRRKRSDLRPYQRSFLEAQPFWGHIVCLCLLSLAGTLLTLLKPLPRNSIVDSVLGSHELPGWVAWSLPAGVSHNDGRVLAIIAGLLVVFALFKQMLDWSYVVLRTRTGEELVLVFGARLFRPSQRLSPTYHDTTGATDSTYRIQYGAPAIRWITMDFFIPLVSFPRASAETAPQPVLLPVV
jgi:ATP-binding cassette, subfamily B, bacterial